MKYTIVKVGDNGTIRNYTPSLDDLEGSSGSKLNTVKWVGPITRKTAIKSLKEHGYYNL